MNAPLQGDLFAPAVEPEEEKRRRVNDLLGRAFVLHCEADEVRVPWSYEKDAADVLRIVYDEDSPEAQRAARLRRQAAALEREADDIIPVEYRTWLRNP